MTNTDAPDQRGLSREQRVQNFRERYEVTKRDLIRERVTQSGGRIFHSPAEAEDEGYIPERENVPLITVFDELGPRLNEEYGQGNWGVTHVKTGPDDPKISYSTLDVWRAEDLTRRRVLPATGAALSLVVEKPDQHDIDK